MNRLFSTIVLICFMLVFVGCASIFCGDDKTVNISSNPNGVNFTISDQKGDTVVQNKTPANITLKRGCGWFCAQHYSVNFETAKGTKKFEMEPKIEWGWYGFGNAVFGGLIGWVIVDPITGAMYTFDDVFVDLTAIASMNTPHEGIGRYIVTINRIPVEMRHRLVRIN